MHRRHPRLPTTWLLTDERLGDVLGVVRRLPRGTGVLVRHHHLRRRERAALLISIRRIAYARDLVVIDEAEGRVARVHDSRELRRALSKRTELLFVSPLHPTRSHPEWKPQKRMRASALVRLSPVPVLGLGGMNASRFATWRALGVAGWGGIDRWTAAPGSRPCRSGR